MSAPGHAEPNEPPTTRFSAQQTASPVSAPDRERPPAPEASPHEASSARGEDREIESWLSELRGPNDRPGDPRAAATSTPPSEPSDDQTRAIPLGGQHRSDQRPTGEDDATTAIPTPPREEQDPDVATQKLNALGTDTDGGDRPRQRRGGGLSAQDLLRREGRI
jgi:RND superfamily putative drug exporter